MLKKLRERADMTQEELTQRAKIARGYVANLEAGHSKNPSIDTLKRLARVLGAPVAKLRR